MVWAWAGKPSAMQQTKRRGPNIIWHLFFISDHSWERVGQTGSLPGFPEIPHRRSQGKLPVCPTISLRFSFHQASQCDIENSSRLTTRRPNRRSAKYSDQFSNAYTGLQAIRYRER